MCVCVVGGGERGRAGRSLFPEQFFFLSKKSPFWKGFNPSK